MEVIKFGIYSKQKLSQFDVVIILWFYVCIMMLSLWLSVMASQGVIYDQSELKSHDNTISMVH